MPKLGVREAAKLLGVSHVTLLKAKARGALEFEPDGKVDTDKALQSEWGRKRRESHPEASPAGRGRPNGIGTGASQPENPDRGPRETPPAPPPAGIPEGVVVRRALSSDEERGVRRVIEGEPQPHGGWLKRERLEEEDGENGEGESEVRKIDLEKRVLEERAEKLHLENEVRRGKLVDRAEIESATEARFRADAEALLNWPARVAAEMAAELGVEERLMYSRLDAAVRRFMAERAKAATPQSSDSTENDAQKSPVDGSDGGSLGDGGDAPSDADR